MHIVKLMLLLAAVPQEKDSLMGELEGLIAQMEDLVRDKAAAEAAAQVASSRADSLAAQLDATRTEAGEAVRAAQTECEQLQAEVSTRDHAFVLSVTVTSTLTL